MKQILFTLPFFALAAVAAPETYQGTGTMIYGGKTTAYEIKITVDELTPPNKVCQITETYTSKGQAPVAYTSVFRFADDGTVTIENNGVRVGSGYCFPQKEGAMWCDYNMETHDGHLHANLFHDLNSHSVYRMGDYTMGASIGRWQDQASLVSGK